MPIAQSAAAAGGSQEGTSCAMSSMVRDPVSCMYNKSLGNASLPWEHSLFAVQQLEPII